ncbi:phospholipase D-like domain-containing protein [Psychromonas sp. Urea-02u-13]|uniref:phospholipase D-like domain-containing protein n=1 Tax=Psychromonas sp. Urea-02u-13 TaxID=2058326 RepID=UPI000C34A6A6|nr:phospholipase D-like domain-containing protein [Psychromonas sp. Urea-02u-13]PKG38001.1 hypothetical protein CXF74_15955 [Psychromonas sp. Urea-02u-13]
MTSDVYFEDIEQEIIKLLHSSKVSVQICVAWINGKIFTPVLKEIAKKGVNVELIYDNNHSNIRHGVPSSPEYSSYAINTRLSGAFMHNKFCIIDDEIVINGSYNWSAKAKDSFENIVVIKNNFKLIKKFKTEFADLISYCHAFSTHKVAKCKCGSHLFNLGVLGQESGLYDESRVEIWSVCVKNQHVKYVGEYHEQYLRTQLGLQYDLDEYYDSPKDEMQDEFKREREVIASLQQYFDSLSGTKIHAVGSVSPINHNEYMQGWEPDLNYEIYIRWRDMYFRKIIPESIPDDGYSFDEVNINSIISSQVEI